MRSPEPHAPPPAEALLHGQFASWGSGTNSNNNSCPNSPGGPGGLSPAASPTVSTVSNYALTLTHTHIYWYPPGKRRKGVSRRRQLRAYLAESRAEAERWSAAVQCLLRGVIVTADTGESVCIVSGMLVKSVRLMVLCRGMRAASLLEC